ncbi:MAG TPA: TA system VapC family ribonuclease toxin [Nocardioides sp.]|nr:TA system VapC family ribonuclease toxin [Nocardioides sp.]
MTTFLLDANVVIALTVAEHEHHERATAWLTTVSRFAVCPVVEGALIRFLLRIGESMETAAAVLEGVRTSERCEFWPDSVSYTDIDVSTIQGHRQVADSYLAALARHGSGQLATFDRALAARHSESCVLVVAD